MSYRVGIGFDIHRLTSGRPLVLAGITIDYDRGLLGHSDGDVIVHAVCDAILGALGLGDIGQMFPDTAKETEGMYSLNMLEMIMNTLRHEHKVVNIDINCICEEPKLSGYRDDMVNNIADTCRLDPSDVSVKFRTNEGLGEIGSGEAISAQAVVLVQKPKNREKTV
ncbi:MAG TPA: 2-C-methyl-D-erythritol 2,4-cyclodiphosphate synthase [Deltaproteobacteria bacterium]|nr:2-C-methyl-D-erythritol 2,4-cyclodiphosphate synthase [Deltaproteobacteria bacterium]